MAAGGTATVINDGTISAGAAGRAIEALTANVTNLANGTITAGSEAVHGTNLVTLNNAHDILATGANGLAVTSSGTINIIANSGTIAAAGTNGIAVSGNNGTVNITANTGTISALGLNGIAITGGAVTVSNANTIKAGHVGINALTTLNVTQFRLD